MQAKLYKFETMHQPVEQEVGSTSANAGINREMYQKIMQEISILRAHICPDVSEDDENGSGSNVPEKPKLNSNLTEALSLKAELDEIYKAISDTKHEIASISSMGFDTSKGRPVDELDAVVKGTEMATEQILTAVEAVENDATILADSLTGDEGLLASNIQEQVISIYEACNFQDITGQRITKVVGALRFIADRTDKMIEIWGGSDNFEEVDPDDARGREGDSKLLNGPALESDGATASQDDIDSLFS